MQIAPSAPIAPTPSSGAGPAGTQAGSASPFAKLLSAQKAPAAPKEKPATPAVPAKAKGDSDDVATDASSPARASAKRGAGRAQQRAADNEATAANDAAAAQAQAQTQAQAQPELPIEAVDANGEPGALALPGGDAAPADPTTVLARPAGAAAAAPAGTDGEAPVVELHAVAGAARRVRAGHGDDIAPKARADAVTQSVEAADFAEQVAVEQQARQAVEEPRHIELRSDAAKLAEAPALTPFAAMQASARGDAAGPAAAVSVALPTPATSPEFREALGVQVSVLARDGVQQAQLHLNPADMGPISVQIALDGTRAQVDFGADSLATRQIIESGLPELAAALRDAGFTLSGGGVSQHARDRARDGGDGSGDAAGSHRADGTGSSEPAPRTMTRMPIGAVDLYA